MSRIFSGIQPTGDLHIGNYAGAIKQWTELCDRFDSIFCVVDYHAITIDYEIEKMRERTLETAIILLAAGLTPDRCKLFVQSHVPEHTELAWVFNCVTPVGDLERMTQFKEKARVHRANVNMGLMDYPVLQASDILLYKAEFVPVGEDQVQHVELSREIARRFNRRFRQIFPEPQVILSEAPRILGLDGSQKMSKSLNNYIGLLEQEGAIWEKLKVAKTDEGRKRRYDPGDPSVCNIFTIHRVFSTRELWENLEKECREAKIGCVDCKKALFDYMMEQLRPLREKAQTLKNDVDYVVSILLENAKTLRAIAKETMDQVREALGLLRFPA